MHLVSFTIEIYYDARTYERQKYFNSSGFLSLINVMVMRAKWNWFRPFDFIIKCSWKCREAVFYAGFIGQLFDISPLTKGAAVSGRNMCSRYNRKPTVILPWMWTHPFSPKCWHSLTGMHYVILHKYTTKWKPQL